MKTKIIAALASVTTLNAADVLWRNMTSGDLGLWLISGSNSNVVGTQTLLRSCTLVNGCSGV